MPNQTENLVITATDDTATAFSSVATLTTQAILRCEDNALRWRADGTAPTATVGARMDVGDVLLFMGNDYNALLKRFQIINLTTGSNASIEGPGLDGFDRA